MLVVEVDLQRKLGSEAPRGTILAIYDGNKWNQTLTIDLPVMENL